MSKLYITNPNTGRKVEYKLELKSKSLYQKLYERNKIIFAQVVVDNLPTDGSSQVFFDTITSPILTIGKLLAKSNCPVYETNIPDRVVKVGLDIHTSIYREYLWYQKLESIVPKFYGKGYVLIKDRKFPCIVIERLDYTLADKMPTTKKQVKKVWEDMNIILEYLKTKNVVYCDFKPTNIMWCSRDNQWKLVDLESFQNNNTLSIAEHTPNYAPHIFLKEKNFTVNFETDLENVKIMMHDLVTFYRKQVHDPWVKPGLTHEEILELRDKSTLELPSWLK